MKEISIKEVWLFLSADGIMNERWRCRGIHIKNISDHPSEVSRILVPHHFNLHSLIQRNFTIASGDGHFLWHWLNTAKPSFMTQEEFNSLVVKCLAGFDFALDECVGSIAMTSSPDRCADSDNISDLPPCRTCQQFSRQINGSTVKEKMIPIRFQIPSFYDPS